MKNDGKNEKLETKEEYKIKDVFAKESIINVNEIIKRTFLSTLKTIELN